MEWYGIFHTISSLHDIMWNIPHPSVAMYPRVANCQNIEANSSRYLTKIAAELNNKIK